MGIFERTVGAGPVAMGQGRRAHTNIGIAPTAQVARHK